MVEPNSRYCDWSYWLEIVCAGSSNSNDLEFGGGHRQLTTTGGDSKKISLKCNNRDVIELASDFEQDSSRLCIDRIGFSRRKC